MTLLCFGVQVKNSLQSAEADIIFTQNFYNSFFPCCFEMFISVFCCFSVFFFLTEKVISIIIIKFIQSVSFFPPTEYEIILKSNCYQGFFLSSCNGVSLLTC